MKFTDRFFSFPVRIYDRFSMKEAEDKEEASGMPTEGSWTAGFIKVEHNEICSWADYFDSEQGIADVEKDGFLFTTVLMSDGNAFICTLNKKDFEAKLNKYAEKYEAWVLEERKKGIELDISEIMGKHVEEE